MQRIRPPRPKRGPFSRETHRRFIRTSPGAAILTRMNAPRMKSGFALSLQIVVVFLGLGMLGLLLWEPHLEGRNAHATTFEIYFHDPFLAYVYLGSVPFFVALQRAFALLGHVRRNGAFSVTTVDALRSIRRCAIVLLGFVAGAVVFVLALGDGEDRPAGIFMCLLAALSAGALATAATLSTRTLERIFAAR